MKWTVHGERIIYDSEWVRLALTDVEIPGGPRFEHHVVRMPADAGGDRRPRPDVGRAALVAAPLRDGHVGVGGPCRPLSTTATIPAEAAVREAYEETGWRLGPVRHLTTYHPHNGSNDCAFHCFVADGAVHVATRSMRARASGWSG